MSVVLDGSKEEGAEAKARFEEWLGKLNEAVVRGSSRDVSNLFLPDGYWKDMLALTWDYDLFSGPREIDAGLAKYASGVSFGDVRLAAEKSGPRACRRGGRDVVEGFFDFRTATGNGLGFARLVPDESGDLKAWMALSALYGLDAAPERIGKLRPSGDEFAQYLTSENWADRRKNEQLYEVHDPEVLIIGAGHSALSLGARLKTMGVDVLLVDRHERVGDSWRKRYHSLSLHNPTFANHMPYLPFPEGWHTWLAKDKLAGWLEAYAETFELNVWTHSTVRSAEFDNTAKNWSVRIGLPDGSERVVRTRQLVFATGVSGSIPNIPEFAGIEDFQGEFIHSASFGSGENYQGKKALIIGTGNSGHDVAQDLVVNEAERVAMLQRGPTCVVSLRPTAETVFSIYGGDTDVEEIDLAAAALPYPVLIDTYQWLVNRARKDDAALLDALHARGFKTHYGSDDTGFHMMYLRGEGGYYIDVGCCRLVTEGKVEIISTDNVDRFVSAGLRMKDGSIQPFDLVVAATGFENMQENIRKVLGDDLADRIGPVWGIDEAHTQQNVWRRTAQEAFWVMGGGMTEARMFSRMLALQIVASLKGLLPPKYG